MPHAQTKFSELWLTSTDKNGQKLREWCSKGQNEYYGYCKFYDTEIQYDSAGIAQLLQHSTKKKHMEATKHSLDEKQSKLQFTCESGRKSTPSTSRAISLTFPGDDSLKAENLWLLKLAVIGFSLRSTDKVGELFQTMFPDSKIAAGFTLSWTKSSYVISHGLSQYFPCMLVKDLLKSELHFCLYFETTTTRVKKQMDLTFRYWSPTHKEVWITYYTSLFLVMQRQKNSSGNV